MDQVEARLDPDGRWHIAKPMKKSCTTGHKLREGDSGYDTLTAEGVPDLARCLNERLYQTRENLCRQCDW